MAQREKGVASAPCRICGTSLNAIAQPDGSTAYETCPKCYPSKSKERAAHSSGPRREHGTQTDSKEE